MVAHQKAFRKLNRTSAHRKAMLRTMVTQLLEHERIITTLPKAKELQRMAEKMITLAKRGQFALVSITCRHLQCLICFLNATTGTPHARRQAGSYVRTETQLHKLFTTFAERYA